MSATVNPKWRLLPPTLRRSIAVPLVLWAVVGITWIFARHQYLGPAPVSELFADGPQRMPSVVALSPLPPREDCYGPRGLPLRESPDDALQYEHVDSPYPQPYMGSQRELGIDKTWMTADGRYGPYGYGEDLSTYSRSRVNWTDVDWGQLQDRCYVKNTQRFPTAVPSTKVADNVRFAFRNQSTRNPTPHWNQFSKSRRTALVVRSYQGFHYTAEVMWAIRALIVEATLRTGAEYAVILLVHVQDRSLNIFESKDNYRKAFDLCGIPAELRSITVLWDDHLLESWYDPIDEHSTYWQANQPLQLFALHYPEFDHYWQLEMDQRFMGDVGKYLDAVGDFAMKEPRKQALERATFPFREQRWSSYGSMLEEVDEANHGKSRAWGPVKVAGIRPIGPIPPTRAPEDDEFLWGVGEDADLIVSSFCADVRTSDWTQGDWMRGRFSKGRSTPRWFCPPAVMRSSRALLLEIHASQHQYGLGVPSEATLPSWALWHGLKLSYPPQPAYLRGYNDEPQGYLQGLEHDEAQAPQDPTYERDFSGIPPKSSINGLSHAEPEHHADYGLTWWWVSDWPRRIMDVWLDGEVDAEDFPSVLAASNGKVYAPNFALHPVKV